MKGSSTEILKFIKEHPLQSSKEIHEGIKSVRANSTLKRQLTKLIDGNFIESEGKGKGTKYLLSPLYNLLYDVDIEQYLE
ncbi:hypothetical protein ADIARSV_3197 [Arcticibacter svalbardensis MN12-7]|uniref:Fic family protein n=1 Tax=Arcticibacter svalbardensis MN12-7 TaxID=1150600 RepID=R9GPH7_9SPHI|nr:hypothetical protein [Arcticibacter svalbardensis]EOR93613.1 hypothetical protein ADIARSV_3197 [Arcticibacter svalbardensis MN12-7]